MDFERIGNLQKALFNCYIKRNSEVKRVESNLYVHFGVTKKYISSKIDKKGEML